MPSAEGSIGAKGTPTHPTRSRPLTPGVYVPTPAFFNDDALESLDLTTLARHAVRLAHAGVTGLAVQGSNGEAVHLTDSERAAVIKTTRKALDEAGYKSMPLIVGTGAQSTMQTIELCRQAAEYGGDAVLVLPPGYYQGLFDNGTVVSFFKEVADASPLPVLVYNYPGAVAGLDLNSDLLVKLGREHPNIVGAKFTCGNTGKLGRVASAFGNKKQMAGKGGSTNGTHHSSPATDFLCFAGSGDFMIPALSTGAAGVIGGIANVAPKAVVKLYQAFKNGQHEEAERLQQVIARGDWTAIQSGIIGVKVCLQDYEGYGGWARKPLPRPEGDSRKKIVEGFKELMDLEKSI
ncbi:hypothetical protein N0V93_001222 [Gnomoniopsis smithogilvyi]|uniref:Dihydrodipicolinate synthetase n=1 Tax=Gnomoniopsis smithogilvyi TaxID=1191159 RepID=A0A9W8Z3H3_9PEZI|nr:hypothetical protein N0V93_001222 [Gnomoniopsis smithogilvyi]